MIAIAMAVYRPHPRYFIEQLRSIQAQEWQDWKCVLTWDSPIEEMDCPGVLDLLRSDPRFVLEQNETRLGAKKNFERAISLASCYDAFAVACADQDDIWHPAKLVLQVRELKSSPNLSLVHSDLDAFSTDEQSHSYTGEPRSVWRSERRNVDRSRPEEILSRNIVTGCTILMDVELARRYPQIPNSFSLHDHWYALTSSCHGGVHPIRAPLVRYRQHHFNLVGVRPPQRVLARLRKVGLSGLCIKSKLAYIQFYRRAKDAAAVGLSPIIETMPDFDRESRYKFSGKLAYRSLGALKDDPGLAQESLKIAIGRLLAED